MPLHRQLFLVLRDQIQRGALLPEDALPTEQALENEYGVSRITVRRALSDLAEQGYVERMHGRGTFVRGNPSNVPSSPHATVMDEARKAELETNSQIVELEPRIPPRPIGLQLRLSGSDEALYLLRLRCDRSSDEPLMITEVWLDMRYAPKVTRSSLSKRSLVRILGDAGVQLGRVVQDISAVIADPVSARLLQVAIGSPLIRMNRLVFDSDGSPVQHHAMYLSPDRSRIVMDIPAEAVHSTESGLIAHDVPAFAPLSSRA
jgi:GntR family transcriptional regulator